MLAGAVGLSGTAERLHVDSCAVVRTYNNKPTTECHGRLLSAGGRLIDTDALQGDRRLGDPDGDGASSRSQWSRRSPLFGWDAAATAGSRYGATPAVAVGSGGLVHVLAVLYEHVFQP